MLVALITKQMMRKFLNMRLLFRFRGLEGEMYDDNELIQNEKLTEKKPDASKDSESETAMRADVCNETLYGQRWTGRMASRHKTYI